MEKVLHISKYYFPFIGGVEQVARDCVNALKDKYEQKVICFNHEKGDSVDEVDGVEVVRASCFAKVASQSLSMDYKKLFKRVLNEFKPDYVVFHYPNPFVGSILTKFLKKKTFKLILWWHLDIVKQKFLKVFFEGQNKKLLKYADKIVATSPNYVEGSPYLSINKEKCVVIPCCFNIDRMAYNDSNIEASLELKKKYEGKTILFAFGRHVPYKGLTYLIQASKLLDDSYKVLIGGKGPLTEELENEAKGDSKVEFLGKISDDDLKNYFLASDIFCFPSITRNEAFGIGLAEAMYYGKPAVTFTIPCSGVNWVSIHNETGLECENGNVQSYADAIKKLASDKALREKLGAAAKERSIEHFTYEKFKENTIQLFDSLEEE
jgi:glycosyltransferase involved in cell wall biosynthesis